MGKKKFDIQSSTTPYEKNLKMRVRLPALIKKIMELGLYSENETYFEISDHQLHVTWIVYSPSCTLDDTCYDGRVIYVQVNMHNYSVLKHVKTFSVRHMKGDFTDIDLQVHVTDTR